MIDINKIKEFSKNHYYAIIIFTFIMIYSFIVPAEFNFWKAEGSTLSIHAVDFGMGFCSKLLPGAIYNLFFDSVGTVKTSAYLTVLMTAFFAGVSFTLEKFLLRTAPEHRKTALIILAFFLTGPSTFSIFIKLPGMLDMYWIFAALLFFVLLSKKHLTPLLFIPFIFCIVVYFTSLLCYIPLFVIAILYTISCMDDKSQKTKLWITVVISTVAAVALGGYFAVFESGNLTYSMEEFNNIILSRGAENLLYYDQSLYKHVENSSLEEFVPNVPEGLPLVLSEIILRIYHTFAKVSINDKLVILALITPIIVLIFKFLYYQIKTNTLNKLKVFSFICMILLPFATMVCALMFSEDVVRWITHAFLPLFVSFLFVLYKEGKKAWIWVEENVSKIPPVAILLYFTVYASTVYHPYYIG